MIAASKPATPRRWSHRLRHSLRWRLLALFLLLALALSAAFVGGIQKSFAVGWRDAVRPLLVDYVDRLTNEIGTPPDVVRAQALVARLPISVRIEGPAVQFDSHPSRPDEPWRHREFNGRTDDYSGYSGYGQDRANARLLLRTTADGHTIRFGLGDLNWQRGPGAFVWITLTALLLLTALAFAYLRRLLKPLDDIGAGAQRFGAGNFSQPIDVRRRDELGDLAALVREVVSDANVAGPTPRFVINAENHLPQIAVDRVRIRLLLRNLLDNAVRHSPAVDTSEDAVIEISLTQINLTEDGNHLRLSVRDHGAGVSESQLSQLAEPFFRTDAGRQRSTGGVGLGLYLCRLVAQAHGGRLILQNAHPGLVVVATLPLKINR